MPVTSALATPRGELCPHAPPHLQCPPSNLPSPSNDAQVKMLKTHPSVRMKEPAFPA